MSNTRRDNDPFRPRKKVDFGPMLPTYGGKYRDLPEHVEFAHQVTMHRLRQGVPVTFVCTTATSVKFVNKWQAIGGRVAGLILVNLETDSTNLFNAQLCMDDKANSSRLFKSGPFHAGYPVYHCKPMQIRYHMQDMVIDKLDKDMYDYTFPQFGKKITDEGEVWPVIRHIIVKVGAKVIHPVTAEDPGGIVKLIPPSDGEHQVTNMYGSYHTFRPARAPITILDSMCVDSQFNLIDVKRVREFLPKIETDEEKAEQRKLDREYFTNPELEQLFENFVEWTEIDDLPETAIDKAWFLAESYQLSVDNWTRTRCTPMPEIIGASWAYALGYLIVLFLSSWMEQRYYFLLPMTLQGYMGFCEMIARQVNKYPLHFDVKENLDQKKLIIVFGCSLAHVIFAWLPFKVDLFGLISDVVSQDRWCAFGPMTCYLVGCITVAKCCTLLYSKQVGGYENASRQFAWKGWQGFPIFQYCFFMAMIYALRDSSPVVIVCAFPMVELFWYLYYEKSYRSLIYRPRRRLDLFLQGKPAPGGEKDWDLRSLRDKIVFGDQKQIVMWYNGQITMLSYTSVFMLAKIKCMRGGKDDLDYLVIIVLQFMIGILTRSGFLTMCLGFCKISGLVFPAPTVFSRLQIDATYGGHYAKYAGWPCLWLVRFLRTYWGYEFGEWDPRNEDAFLDHDDPKRLNNLWCFNYHALICYFLMMAVDMFEDQVLHTFHKFGVTAAFYMAAFKGAQKSRMTGSSPYLSDMFHPQNLLQFPRETNDSSVKKDAKDYDLSLNGCKDAESGKEKRTTNTRFYNYMGGGTSHLPTPSCLQVNYYGQGISEFFDYGWSNGLFMFTAMVMTCGRDYVYGFGPPGEHGVWDSKHNMPGDMWIWPYDTPIGKTRDCGGTCEYNTQ